MDQNRFESVEPEQNYAHPPPSGESANLAMVAASSRSRLERAKDWFGIFQSFVTIVALIAGGYWFFLQRELFPSAVITHEITHRRITNAGTWLHVSVKISNMGKRVLDLDSAILRVQQILPLHQTIKKQINRGDLILPGEEMVRWPELDQYQSNRNVRIEPGENDVVNYEFIVPSSVETVKIYSYFAKEKEPPLGWHKTSIYDLREEGARESTSRVG